MSTFKAPKGTYDLIPPDSAKFLAVREAIAAPLRNSGYGYIETPGFENVELFARGVGESTDIVTKEMYAFETKGGDKLALRPEGTASVLRAALEANLHKPGNLPVKLWYSGSYYRYERPQKGRYRHFSQVGAEAIGAEDPALDAELIILARPGVPLAGPARTSASCSTRWATRSAARCTEAFSRTPSTVASLLPPSAGYRASPPPARRRRPVSVAADREREHGGHPAPAAQPPGRPAAEQADPGQHEHQDGVVGHHEFLRRLAEHDRAVGGDPVVRARGQQPIQNPGGHLRASARARANQHRWRTAGQPGSRATPASGPPAPHGTGVRRWGWSCSRLQSTTSCPLASPDAQHVGLTGSPRWSVRAGP